VSSAAIGWVRPCEGGAVDDEFVSGRFRFRVEHSDSLDDQLRGFHEELTDDTFDLRVTRTGWIPELNGAPIASWFLARLNRLTDNCPWMGGKDYVDGGGFAIDFVAYLTFIEPDYSKAPFVQPLLFDMKALGLHVEPDRPVASFQFQGDMQGVAVLGQRAADCPAEEVLDALAAALVKAPEQLLECKLEVIDPEWKLDPEIYTPRPRKGTRNEYGWDGTQFLGRWNVRDADLSS
jgi:hypothetical protein